MATLPNYFKIPVEGFVTGNQLSFEPRPPGGTSRRTPMLFM